VTARTAIALAGALLLLIGAAGFDVAVWTP